MNDNENNLWKLQLVERTINYLTKLGSKQPGNEWQRKFVKALVSDEFTKITIRNRDEYSASRLMGDIESQNGRGRIFKQAAEQFSDEPHVIAQYGRFLYDEETRFEESRKYLEKAFKITKETDEKICHMLGMSYRRELQERLKALGNNKPSDEQLYENDNLRERASHYFKLSRELVRENDYAYTAHIQLLIDLIRQGFKQFDTDVSYPQRLHERADIRNWFYEAFSIIDEAQIYIEYSQDTFLGKLEADLMSLRGDLSKAIEAYENILTNANRYQDSKKFSQHIDPNPIKRQLARCLYQRGMENIKSPKVNERNRAQNDLKRASEYLQDLIRDQPSHPYNLGFWFQCARLNPLVSKSILIERLEGYYARTQSLDGAFYLMCLFFIRGIEEKNPSAFSEYERYLKDSKRLATNLTHRLNRREWLGAGNTLIPNKSISFDSQKEEPITKDLPRIEGTIKYVGESSGEISIPPYGKTIHFKPKRHDKKFYKSDEGKKVTFNVAFTYDKPIAYDVRFSNVAVRS
jgi:hypothetical protein